jgi:Tfp pilus assembly protein PilX
MTLISKRMIHSKGDRQYGAVLIAALIFVLIMTAMVLSVMRGATLEERMASNSINHQRALQAAESAVRYAEATLFTKAPLDPFDRSKFVDDCSATKDMPTSGGYCAAQSAPRWASHTWSDTTAGVNKDYQISGVSSQPSFIIELVGQEGGQNQKLCPKLILKITGRGVGADGSQDFVETMYRYRPTSFADGSCG